MARFLLDTNHLSDAINPVSPFRDRLHRDRRSGHVFGLCTPVLCELETGIQQFADQEPARRALERLLQFLRVWPTDPPLAYLFGELSNDLRRRAHSLSQLDR